MIVWMYDCIIVLYDCIIVLYDCMIVWLYDCMIVWLYECMSVWVYECMIVWLYDCMIENDVYPVTMMFVYITILYCFDCMSMVIKGVSRVYLYTLPWYCFTIKGIAQNVNVRIELRFY